jgi:hypothetical protein
MFLLPFRGMDDRPLTRPHFDFELITPCHQQVLLCQQRQLYPSDKKIGLFSLLRGITSPSLLDFDDLNLMLFYPKV